jgi:DNA polymerase-3 subunit alpha
LFDMTADGHGSISQEPPLPTVKPWGIKERLSYEKTAVGFYLSGHLFDEVEREVRQFVRRTLSELTDSREPQLMAGIVGDFRVINGQRGKLGLFKLDDKSGALDARVDEALIHQHRNLLKDDEFIVVLAKVMQDRFSGGLQLQVTQVWDLPSARCRFGKFLRVAVNGKSPDVRRLLSEYPPQKESTEHGDLLRGLPVRLLMERRTPAGGVMAQLQLGDQAVFYPSDAALASWMAQADEGRSAIVYE